ncbi:Imm10 family immunity protein [Capnocytophaga sp.]|uniref:Imm10 family immunity protein n=1 Tax=Capnocytophaga sp. TaxID=44737 RepID=UPI0026DD6800|nr:Imm10 family immunity protein [Capnocytophaga sp.]MDO5106080.1 Imm10 family immunity protein [Capnocytophaga sp.]
MKFQSKNSVYYIEDDILTIAFADSKKPNPKKYLILQREIDHSDLYYYEFCSQEYANDGGFKKVTIKNNLIEIVLNESENIYKQGVKIIEISFEENKEIKEIKHKLISLFENSDVELCVFE